MSVAIVRVAPQLYTGDLKALTASNPLDEQSSLRHSGDFAAHPENYEFEWRYAPPQDGVQPPVYTYSMETVLGTPDSDLWFLASNPAAPLPSAYPATEYEFPRTFPVNDAAHNASSGHPGTVVKSVSGLHLSGPVPARFVLSAELGAHDGFVLYVNGTPALASRLPSGIAPPAGLASTDARAGLSPSGLTYQYEVPPAYFVIGDNRIEIALYSSANPGAASSVNLRLDASVETDHVVASGSPWTRPNGTLSNTVVGGGSADSPLGNPLLVFSDNYFTMRYRPKEGVASAAGDGWSRWMTPQLVESWIKRALDGINPFTQRTDDLFNNPVSTDVSILTQAGTRWEGDVALTLDNIDDFGFIEIYETLLTVPPIPLPPTVDEDLVANYKPTAHAAVKAVMAGGLGIVATPQVQQEYLNFYARLMKKVDGQIGELLAVFDENGTAGAAALNETLIVRTSDHGELGMCHGALRQKTFVAYDEALRVPLIWSNPVLYPSARTSDALVSHVDLLPTICALAGVPDWQSKGFAGIDYSGIVLDGDAPPVQDYVLFTFDDIYAGGDAANFPNGTVPPPNCLRMIRTEHFKYVRYFDPNGEQPDQQEFYDLRPTGGDFNVLHGLPLESRNLSLWAQALREIHEEPLELTPDQQAARTALMAQLATLEPTRLAPRAYAASVPPEDLKIEIKRWTDPDLGPQAKVQITFLSQLNTNYQLQRSIDLVQWDDAGSPVPGNSGRILMSDALEDEKAFYRIQWSPAA